MHNVLPKRTQSNQRRPESVPLSDDHVSRESLRAFLPIVVIEAERIPCFRFHVVVNVMLLLMHLLRHG